MQRKDTRPLTVLGNTWEYKIGRKTVAIYSPKGERYFPKIIDIVGEKSMIHTDILNRKTYQINPALILDYIYKKILDTEVQHTCKSCGKKKPDVILRVNPFNAEIHMDYSKHYLCNNCCNVLKEEI